MSPNDQEIKTSKPFREKVASVVNNLEALKEKHFYEPAGAKFCLGQILKKNPHPSFHCYEPTCPQHWRHHQLVRAECKPHSDGDRWIKQGDPNADWGMTKLELTMPGRGNQFTSRRTSSPREQIVVSEMCEAFGEPRLRALNEPWQCDGSDKGAFDKLFDDTAVSLALFLKDEVQHLDNLKPPLAVEQNPELKSKQADFWMALEPQVKDTIKVLWQGDLNAEGVYLNIAMHIRRLSSRLLMHAMGKWLSSDSRASPQELNFAMGLDKMEKLERSGASPEELEKAAGHRSAGNKALFLTKKDPRLEPFADLCELIDKLATAIVHHKDAADFELASKSTGNTTIIMCRGIVLACAKYMDWFGWSSTPSSYAQKSNTEFIGSLKRQFVKFTNEIASCTVCMSKPLIFGFLHGGSVHWSICEGCVIKTLKSTGGCCPQCMKPANQVVRVFKQSPEETDDGSAGPTCAQVDETRAAANKLLRRSQKRSQGVQTQSSTEPPEADMKRRRTGLVMQESSEASMSPEPLEAEASDENREELKGIPTPAREEDPKVVAQRQFASMSLKDSKQHVDAARVEQTAAALWDEGQHDRAEATLKEALSRMGPSPQKVILMLRLLEYSVQQLSLNASSPKQAECQALVLDLSALIVLLTASASTSGSGQTSASKNDNSSSTSSSGISPALLRRFHFWRGRLQALLGRHADAANAFYHAAAAAQQGSGDASRCFVEAAACLYAHAKAMEAARQLSPALGAAEASLEAANASGSTPHIIRAAVLGATLHSARAEAARTPRDYLPALQLYVLALKQLLQAKSPTLLPMAELRASDVEAIAAQCRSALECVVPLYMQDASSKPLAFVAEVECVLKDTAQLINAVKLQEEVQALGTGLEWMKQSAARVKRTLDALAKDAEWVQSLPSGKAPPNSASSQQQPQRQQSPLPQPRPNTVFGHLARHRQTLSSFWNKFDVAGFKGLPIPSDETESDRQLREAITRDVFRYFEESGKQLMAQRGQKIPEGPPAFSPKMQAFCQIVAFKMYMGTRGKPQNQSPQPTQQDQAQTEQDSTQATADSMDTDPPAANMPQGSNPGMSQFVAAVLSTKGDAQVEQDKKALLTESATVPHKQLGKQPQGWSAPIKQECSPDITPEVASAKQTSTPEAACIRPPRSTVTSFLNQHKQALTSFWNSFDVTGFKDLPIPSNETESERKLREEITRDVYLYFEASSKQLMAQRGQQIPEGPPSYSPKMHGFVQTVAFKMYMGHMRKSLKEKVLPEHFCGA